MRRSLADFLEAHSMKGIPAYIAATAAMIAATALRVAFNPLMGEAAPYALQAIMLLVIAFFAGHGPSLLALAIGLTLGHYLIPPHDQSVQTTIMSEFSTTIAGIMIALVTSGLRAALLTAAAARREADFLSREMHHRIKNLFAVVGSMMTLSAREDPKAQPALTDLRARLQALSHAHDIVLEAFDYVDLHELVDRLLAPHGTRGAGESRVRVGGPPLCLPPSYLTPLTLIINELATNAVKHGSLGRRRGSMRLSWSRRDDKLDILWEETPADRADIPPELGASGFGSLLVEASVAQLRGRMDRDLTDDGLLVRLTIPCQTVERKRFRSDAAADRQEPCNRRHSSLSALRGSRRFFRRNPRIRDSRS